MNKEAKEFEHWFNSTFLFSRDPTSMILNSENKAIIERYSRICEICKRRLSKPNQPVGELRKEIAMDMFVTMRIALDYINYANLVLEQWHNRKV